MQYRTSLTARPAVALKTLIAPPPNVDRDVYDGYASRAAVDLDRQAQMANADSMKKQVQEQTRMATQGMQQVASARQNSIDLAAARRNAANVYLNSLLGGLFR